jgi:anti-sigma B factor antagonist
MMSDSVRTGGASPPEDNGLALARALRPRGPVQLALRRRPAEGATIIEVVGELDVLTASRLRAEIDQIVRRQAGDVVLDLRATGFVDSAGLQLLLTAKRRLSRQQRALAIVCDPGPVRRMIAQARLLDALGVVSSVGELAGRPTEAASRSYRDG